MLAFYSSYFLQETPTLAAVAIVATSRWLGDLVERNKYYSLLIINGVMAETISMSASVMWRLKAGINAPCPLARNLAHNK